MLLLTRIFLWSLTCSQVTIVVVSRLAYRKGVDLLVAVAPRICKLFPNVRFLVGSLPGHVLLFPS